MPWQEPAGHSAVDTQHLPKHVPVGQLTEPVVHAVGMGSHAGRLDVAAEVLPVSDSDVEAVVFAESFKAGD